MRRQIVAIDFDGTIVEHAFPGIGGLKNGAKEALNTLHKSYDIVIFSTRPAWGVLNGYPKCFDEMVTFLDANKLPYTRVAKKEDGKILADYYIDDLAIEFKNNWPEIVGRLVAG